MTDPLEQLADHDVPVVPDANFAAALKRRIEAIERRTQLASAHPTNGDEMSTQLIPYLSVDDARAAVDFYTEVFGAQLDGELFEMGDGRIGHATLKIGESTLYLADEFPEMNIIGPIGRGGTSVAVVINVADADETYAHALAAGATAERPVENQHGFRSGWFQDPWGHRWSPTSPAKV